MKPSPFLFNNLRLSRRTGLYSLALLLVLSSPFAFLHEMGHAIICVSEGFTFTLFFGLAAFGLECMGEPVNSMLYHMFGGLFAAMVAAIPFVFYSKIKRYPFIIIAFLTVLTGHAINAAVETLMFDYYITQTKYASLFVLIPSLAAFFIYLFYFGTVKSPRVMKSN